MSGIRKKGGKYYYRFVDADGKRRERAGCPDKRVTQEMQRAAEIEAAKIRKGLLDPKQLAYGVHEAWPLSGHLDDWHAHLLGKGATRKHAHMSRQRARQLIELSGAKRISDLSLSKAQAAIAALQGEGYSLRSIHHYKRALKGFSRWLWRDGRAREDILAHLQSPNPNTDRRRQRRALDAAEMMSLIRAAENGPVVFGMTGPDRAVLYRVALGTGFRANELRSLTPESFELDGSPPTITVAAAYSKRRRDDRQPIQRELADSLRPWLSLKSARKSVFGKLTDKTAEMLREDLAAAKIPERDAQDRVIDFHSLRHTYVTALARSNAPVKVVQTLARHSSPALTLGIYTHLGIEDQSGALAALPDLSAAASDEPLAAQEQEVRGKSIAPHLPHREPANGRELSDSDVNNKSETQGRVWPDRSTEILESSDLASYHRLLPDTVAVGNPAVVMYGTNEHYRSTEPKVSGSNPDGCIDLHREQPELAPGRYSGPS